MKTIKLQGMYKEQKAIEAKDLKVGDITVWNYGYKEEILNIEFSKTGKTMKCEIKSLESGKNFIRKISASRLVALA